MYMIKDFLSDFIDKTRKLNVLIIGETIVDEFIYVNYEGQSMKSICPVFKLESREKIVQQGGAAAIFNHLKEFVKSVNFITNTNNEIVKTRYVDINDNKKHVEINKFDTASFPVINVDTKDYDIVIVADFGHGFCDKLTINDGFHLMCQTNSNNFGFNRISKWKSYKKKSVCVDLREASLQVNKRIHFNQPDELLELFNYEMKTENLFLTLGQSGSVYTNGKEIIKQKKYESEIVDTIGAGDTFFTFACLVSAIPHDNIENIMRIPALAASLSTTWLCNEKSVTQNSLLKYADKLFT